MNDNMKVKYKKMQYLKQKKKYHILGDYIKSKDLVLM